ncbi:MAG: hypothetical protein IT561_14065, partial [Alphaproteobacteria bacterium]|nr:hypothetical protein [Alphaproteobacteria bacterium]
LESAGFDRAALSILAADSVLAPSLTQPREAVAAADDDHTAKAAVVSDTDVRQGRTLATSMAGVVGAFIATGATIVSGGGVLAAIVGAAAVGGGAAAAVEAIGQKLGGGREAFLERQIARGGILLWVAMIPAGREDLAMTILRRHGADDVHIHDSTT